MAKTINLNMQVQQMNIVGRFKNDQPMSYLPTQFNKQQFHNELKLSSKQGYRTLKRQGLSKGKLNSYS